MSSLKFKGYVADTENSKERRACGHRQQPRLRQPLCSAKMGAPVASAISISPLFTFMFTLHNVLQEPPRSLGPISAVFH